MARTRAARAIRAWSSPSRSSCRPTPRAEEVEQWLVRERLHARAGRARGRDADRAAQGARRRRRPLPHPGRPRRCARSRRSRWRSSAAAGGVNVYVVAASAEGGRTPDDLWRFSTGLHCPDSDIRYADPQPALFSFNSAVRRLRDLPRLRPRDRRRLGLVIPDDTQDAARRRDQDDPDAGLEGVPGRPDEVRRRGRHPARHAWYAAHRRRSATG